MPLGIVAFFVFIYRLYVAVNRNFGFLALKFIGMLLFKAIGFSIYAKPLFKHIVKKPVAMLLAHYLSI